MKLRLPHKLQTALLAAVASVSFTTVSTATLGAAAAWAFFSGHAGAEDLTHDPILTQQLDHAKQIEFGKLSLSETGAEQVENNVAKSSFGSGDVTRVDAAATPGGDIVDAVLCEGYSEAGGSWQADAAALSAALDPAATSEFVTAEGLATVDSGEPVFSTTTAAAPAAAATSSLDLAPQQDNSYNATTATGSSSSSNNTSVSAPAVGAGAGAGSFGGASGYVASSRSTSRPAAMKTAGLSLDSSVVGGEINQVLVNELELTTNAQEAVKYRNVAMASASPLKFSGTILTWDNVMSGKSGDLAYGNYKETIYDPEENSFSYTGTTYAGWTNPNQGLIASNSGTRNTLRFAASDYGQTIKGPVYTFTPLTLAGIIVDKGATGYSITSSSTSERTIYLGNPDGTAAYSLVCENFSINKSTGSGKVYLRGTQTIDVASGKTYTITSNNGVEISGSLTLQGGGTLALQGNGDLVSQESAIISLDNSNLGFRADGGSRTYGLAALTVKGTSRVSIYESGTQGYGWNATVNINALRSVDSSAVVSLGNAARANGSVFNIKGGAFSGEIVMLGEATTKGTKNRMTAVQLQDADVASESVLCFDVVAGNAQYNSIGLGIGTDVTLLGIRNNAQVESTIYSGSLNAGYTAFSSTSDERHSITITGSGDYVTSATLLNKLDLVMNGQGSQKFTGNMESFDGSITVRNGTLDISGDLGTGVSAVTVTGGTLLLSGRNTFTSDITVEGGTLKLGSSSALGKNNGGSGASTRTIAIGTDGVIDINGTDDTSYAYVLAGGKLVNNGSATTPDHIQTTKLSLTADSAVGGTGTFYLLTNNWGDTAIEMGGNTLTKEGTNILYLWSTAVTGGGTLKICNGVVDIGRHDDKKTLSSLATNIELAKGGSAVLKGTFSLAGGYAIRSSVSDARSEGYVTLLGAVTLDAGSGCSLSSAGDLSGAGSVVKTGAGTVTLSGNNSYTGGTTVSAGTLVAGNATALGTGAVTLTGGMLDLASAATVGSLTMGSGTLKLAGADMLTSTGAINLAGGTLDLTRLTLTEGTEKYTLASTTGTLTLGGSVGFTLADESLKSKYSLVTEGNTLYLAYNPVEDLIWRFNTGTWGAKDEWFNEAGEMVTFADKDNVTIDAAFDHVTIAMNAPAEAGEIVVKYNEGTPGDTTTVTINRHEDTHTLSAKSLQLQEGTRLVTNTRMEVSDTVTMAAGTEWTLNSPLDATLTAMIMSESDNSRIIKQGEATLLLAGDNTLYQGDIVVEHGTLVAGSSLALGSDVAEMGGAKVTVKTGAGLTLDPGAAAAASGISLLAEGGESIYADSLTLEAGSTLTFTGNTDLVLHGGLTLGGAVNFDLTKYGFIDGEAGTPLTVTLITTGSAGVTGDDYLASANILRPSNVETARLEQDGDNVLLTFTWAESRTLYWQGGLGDWSTDKTVETWHPGQNNPNKTHFNTGDSVVFDTRTATSSVSVLDESITAGNITVEQGTHVVFQSRDNSPATTVEATTVTLDGSLTTHVALDATKVVLGDKGVLNMATDVVDRTLGAAVSGTGTLAKSEDGTLTLSGNNSAFTGTLDIRQGTVVAGSANALGNGSTINMADGTTLAGMVTANIGGNTTIATSASAAVSANLNLANGSTLRFVVEDKSDVICVDGNVTGSGSLVKNGFGTLYLNDTLSYTGTTTVMEGTLALAKGQSFTTGGNFTLSNGAILVLSGNEKLVSTAELTLAAGSILDLSNITLGEDKKAYLATAQTITSGVSTPKTGRMLEGVFVSNLEGVGGTNYARVHLEAGENGTQRIYVKMYGDDYNGCYWRGVTETTTDYAVGSGEWIFTDSAASSKPAAKYWVKANGTLTLFEGRNGSIETPRSAYFFALDGVEESHVYMKAFDEGDHVLSAIRDMIIEGKADGTGTKYIFENDESGEAYLNFSTTQRNSLIVRNNATAVVYAGVRSGDGGIVSIEKGSSLTFDAPCRILGRNASILELGNLENSGTLNAEAYQIYVTRGVNAGTAVFEATGEMSTQSGGWLSAMTLWQFANMQGATMTIESDGLEPVEADGAPAKDAHIDNDGALILRDGDKNTLPYMTVSLPIAGSGDVKTEGGKLIFQDSMTWGDRVHSSVIAQNLELDAETSIFESAVNITAATTVNSGKNGYFYGGTGVGTDSDGNRNKGTLGDVTIKSGIETEGESQGKDTLLVFGPSAISAWGVVSGYSDEHYDVKAVTAGDHSTMEVNNGASVKIDSFNAGFTANVGNITVGTDRTGATGVSAAALTINGVANLDVFTVVNGTATVQGNASINKVMQDGGTLTLEKNSVLNGSPVSEGSTTLTGGTVTGGTLVLDNGMTLDQNAVVDVRKAEGAGSATYTISGQGSKIDATDLELEKSTSTTLYREAVVTGGSASIGSTQTDDQSGFICSGDEFVKLFDMEAGTTLLTSTNDGHYDQRVVHSSASDEMILIDSTIAGMTPEELMKKFGITAQYFTEGSVFNPRERVGWAFLHTAALALKSYYVRDDYVGTGSAVTLHQVYEASKGEGESKSENPNLETVVFDTTNHNVGKLTSGSLTVDVERADMQMFVVEGPTSLSEYGTFATLNVDKVYGSDTQLAVVAADSTYTGVDGYLTLEGVGIYEIKDRNDLGKNVSLRDNTLQPAAPEWDGTVRVTGTSTSLSVEKLSVGEGADASTLEFKHWTGALESGEHSSDAKIVLTGTAVSAADPAAMDLLGTEDIAYTFTNTVTGANGRVKHSNPEEGEAGNVALTFTGDTSDWNGIYEQNTATKDALTFTGGTEVNANVVVSQGDMALTYGGTVTTVNSDVTVYKGGEGATNAVVSYTGGEMTVSGLLYSDGRSSLTLNVGPADGETDTVAAFTGEFVGTEKSLMLVNEDSTAKIETDAELLRVYGSAGSNVTVGTGKTLKLSSTDAENSYSEFHQLTNAGTIDMKADGGSIHLVVDEDVQNPSYKVGVLELTDAAGEAAIETATNGQAVQVDITSLSGPKDAGQVLALENQDGTGTVNYNLGGDTHFTGTIQFGADRAVSKDATGVTNVVLKSDDVAANAVLKSTGTQAGTANVVVDTANASVKGITSDDNPAGTVYGTDGSANKKLTITGDGEYSYKGDLGANLDIAYTGDGQQTFEGNADSFNGKVTVDNGSTEEGVLKLLDAASMNITDLTIGANNTLAVQKGSVDANVTVSGTLLARGGSTTAGTGNASRMDANLTLADKSVLDVSAARGIGGLDLGGTLTIASGALLSQADMATVWNMEVGDKYDLAFNVTGMVGFGNEVNWAQGVDAAAYFGNGMKEGEFYIRYTGEAAGGNGSNVGQVFLYRLQTPEPTTGTLSLLALAALCARRRRKA